MIDYGFFLLEIENNIVKRRTCKSLRNQAVFNPALPPHSLFNLLQMTRRGDISSCFGNKITLNVYHHLGLGQPEEVLVYIVEHILIIFYYKTNYNSNAPDFKYIEFRLDCRIA